MVELCRIIVYNKSILSRTKIGDKMNVIYSTDVAEIIRKTLSVANSSIADHGEITGYILYKMLKYECLCSEKDLVDFTMIGILHDFGLYKVENLKNVAEHETKSLWEHSIYGYLFLKYLSLPWLCKCWERDR